MGSLITFIAALTGTRFGVNVLDQDPAPSVQGASTNKVAVVANLPWGPVDVVREATSLGELLEQFCPAPFQAENNYPALKAFVNKPWAGALQIARISPTGQAAATRVFNDASAGASVAATARHPGLLGNSISVAWVANADDAAARDAIVTIGSAYSVLYKRVATIVSTVLVVTDPGDPYVGFAKSGGATLVPVAAAAAALATGADGTAVAGDYTTGLALFQAADASYSVGFVAEPEEALIDAINAAILALVDALGQKFWILCVPNGQTHSTARTYVAGYRNAAGRLAYPWPKVEIVNPFDPLRGLVEVQPNSFLAATMTGINPEESPAGKPGAAFLTGIKGLETSATQAQLELMRDDGIIPLYRANGLGMIWYGGNTTCLTSGKTQIFRRRMTDFIIDSLANYLVNYVGTLLDIDLATKRLGPNTDGEIAGVNSFLEDLKNAIRIKNYTVDPFSANTIGSLALNQFRIATRVQLFPVQDEIVLLATIGETVQIDETT